jgi:hypothetical protein
MGTQTEVWFGKITANPNDRAIWSVDLQPLALLVLRVRNPPVSMAVPVLWMLCCQAQWSLHMTDVSGGFYRAVCVSEIVKPQQWVPGPLGAVVPWRKEMDKSKFKVNYANCKYLQYLFLLLHIYLHLHGLYFRNTLPYTQLFLQALCLQT